MTETLKVVTAFTLAHSITLSLAALELVSLPSRVVESVIAASVELAAPNNLRGTVDRRRWGQRGGSCNALLSYEICLWPNKSGRKKLFNS